MKPPEEIKKDLGRCLDRWAPVHFESCESDCPYHSEGTLCKSTLHSDVIAYIQQLESRLAQVERERDAAVKDLAVIKFCALCKEDKSTQEYGSDRCYSCANKSNWEWRGVCAENTEEE